MKKHLLLLLLSVLLSVYLSSAQFYEYGVDPASVEWKTAGSRHFKLIFPSGFTREAARVMMLLEEHYDENSAGLHHQPGKFTVLLHTSPVISNGFVVWAPKRMELFMCPDVNGFAQTWDEQLVLHEFRHEVQVDKLRQGVTKILTIVLGQQGIGPAAGMVPFWFLEGDAVYAETNLSQSGRGRLPSFEMGLKAHLLTDKNWYSFSKSYLGSYRDFVPDYYRYGYQMVSYARYKYGDGIWSGALDYVGRNPWFINPLAFYLNRETGSGKAGLYRHTMAYIREHWRNTADNRVITIPEAFNNRKRKVYTSWNYPCLLPDSSIVAVKSGLGDIHTFVRLFPDGREEHLFTPGRLYSGRISVKNNRIIWDEYVPDLRWSNRSFSVIREYDFLRRQSTTLGRMTRFSSPAWSASGDTIVAVETTKENHFNLVFLSPGNGDVWLRVPSPGNIQLQDPAWIPDSAGIVVIGINQDGKTLLMYDRNTGKWTTLLPASFVNISAPVATGDFIIFNGSYNGVDDLFALNIHNRKLRKITRSRYGAFEPSVDPVNGRIAWADYTARGYNIAVEDLDPGSFIAFDTAAPVTEQTFFSYRDSAAEERAENARSARDTVLQPAEYSRAGHLFHFHSWSPFWFDYSDPNIDNPVVSPGITLLSQNILGTAVTTLGYEYRNDEHYLHSHFIYKGWFPVFDFSVTWGGYPGVNVVEHTTPPAQVKTNLDYSLNTYIPLTFNTGKMFSGAQPSLDLTFNNSYFYYESLQAYKSGMLYAKPRLYLYSYLRTSHRDIQPRWGITVDGSVTGTPFDNEQLGTISVLRSNIYLPGLLRHHGLRMNVSLQRQQTKRYLFFNSVHFPRGYHDQTALNINRLTADYMFPLVYPDLDLPGLLYLKRIRGDLFADMMKASSIYVRTPDGVDVSDGTYRSYGAALYFDYHIFRLLFPLESGVRVSYLQNEDRYIVEGLFSVNLGFF